jgi:hypothetical protein
VRSQQQKHLQSCSRRPLHLQPLQQQHQPLLLAANLTQLALHLGPSQQHLQQQQQRLVPASLRAV